MCGSVADLRQLLVLLVGVKAVDRLTVGEAEHDDAVGHEVTLVDLGVAAAGQILAAMSGDELADALSIGPEGLRVMDVEVDNEIGAHRSDSTGTCRRVITAVRTEGTAVLLPV
jgi:hypothetical protein